MATGSQSDVSEDFNEQTVEKKEIKAFCKAKVFEKSKTHPDRKRNTDIPPPSNTPKPPPIDVQAWLDTSNKQSSQLYYPMFLLLKFIHQLKRLEYNYY